MEGRWTAASETHPGNRRKNNEDAVLVTQIGLWAVADGMGGHSAGDLASNAITEALAGAEPRRTLAEMVDQVDDLLCDVNHRLRDHGSTHLRGRTIGSTVVTLLAGDDVGVALWAGDSRLYRLRHGVLTQITRDHNPIGDLLDDGLITEHTALARETNVVTRAVGGHGQLFLDVAVFDICLGDTFLLCTDGLYRELNHDQIRDLLDDASVNESATRLVAECLANGARDNVSVVVSRRER
ncbi:MAG TPA: protein phosphatase 2C domain-containing protein [Pseudomonadales bacterium]|nr:protein phosphatase 2C domain-containing protein [Pseudomonadales bacterium]